jgi:hypothetical protein
MTTAEHRLTMALIALAVRGERPRCSDPVDHALWTSDDQHDRAVAVQWCAGCPIIDPCGQAADERGERWQVWGSKDYTRGRSGQEYISRLSYPGDNSKQLQQHDGRGER